MHKVELRAKLNKEKFECILDDLIAKDSKYDTIVQDIISFASPYDVRIKLIDNSYYLVNFKGGDIGDIKREDIVFELKKKDFRDFIRFMLKMGYRQYNRWLLNGYVFSVNDAKIYLKNIADFGYYIEFELRRDKKNDVAAATKYLREMMKDLDVEEMSRGQYYDEVKSYREDNVLNTEVLLA